MESEHSKTLAAVRTAIQMEIDGKQYYLKAGQSSGNELGRKLFQQLAAEEDRHREKFEEIFKGIQKNKAWPVVNITPHDGKEIMTILAGVNQKVKSSSTELEAVQTAMAMENKTRDFYQEQARSSTFAAQKKYYDILAQEESVHHGLLLDYYEYIQNPADYFTMKEHHSLDGG
jgi:rubrerythrin